MGLRGDAPSGTGFNSVQGAKPSKNNSMSSSVEWEQPTLSLLGKLEESQEATLERHSDELWPC